MTRASDPASPGPLPGTVARIGRGRDIRLVWGNALGGATYELIDGERRSFLKWAPAGSPVDLSAERDRLVWAAPFASVPRVLGFGVESDGAWLHTRALPGGNAIAPFWRARPEAAVHAIGAGLRAFHDALPVTECPFTWSIAHRLEDLHRRARAGDVDPAQCKPEHRALSLEEALTRLQRWPRGARAGTTAPAGRRPCSKPTATTSMRSGTPTTGCSTTSDRPPGRLPALRRRSRCG